MKIKSFPAGSWKSAIKMQTNNPVLLFALVFCTPPPTPFAQHICWIIKKNKNVAGGDLLSSSLPYTIKMNELNKHTVTVTI